MYLRSPVTNSQLNSFENSGYDTTEPENLEITSNDDQSDHNAYLNEENYFDTRSDIDFVFPQEEISTSSTNTNSNQEETNYELQNIFLSSMKIMRKTNRENDKHSKTLKVECQLWTRGFDRSFKVFLKHC